MITPEQIETMFEKMPERIREQVLNSSFDDTIKQLSTSYQFNEEQERTLSGQTTMLVAGLLTGEEFIKNIKDLANADQKTAEIIFIDVTEFILNPIMDRYYYRETEPAFASAFAEASADKEASAGEGKTMFTPEEEAGIEERVKMRMKMKQVLGQMINIPTEKTKSVGELIEERKTLEAEERGYQREGTRNLVEAKSSRPEIGRDDRPTSPAGDLFREKLGGTFGLPMEETDYSLDTNTANKDTGSANTANKDANTTNYAQPKRDPYRIEPE